MRLATIIIIIIIIVINSQLHHPTLFKIQFIPKPPLILFISPLLVLALICI